MTNCNDEELGTRHDEEVIRNDVLGCREFMRKSAVSGVAFYSFRFADDSTAGDSGEDVLPRVVTWFVALSIAV